MIKLQDNLLLQDWKHISKHNFSNYSVAHHGIQIIFIIDDFFVIIVIFINSFHHSHCAEALSHTDGDMGKALEILFSKYYKIDSLPKNEHPDSVDMSELLQRRQEEKEALQSIYGDTFSEKIKNQIWTIDIKLDYLVESNEVKKFKSKPKVPLKEVCRGYLAGKCKFGIKCRFIHQKPEPAEKPRPKKDSHFTLEIRFPMSKAFLNF